ncbi:MAG: antitoxin [Bacteroidetes bacterium]|nr:MAG: antitoxin [Bacteroidota bacterium]
MDNNIKKLLFDISTSIDNIETYIGAPKIFDKYDSNPMLQDAVERNIEIIGEAMNKILKIDELIEISNARRVVDARNLLIHGYDDIDNAQIWGIIINHLPKLKQEVEALLEV